jgi:CRISPR/Cas system-associated endoribonuclease Cas2
MAQIDPNILLTYKPPQIQDPLAATARAQDIGVNALKMQELQRGLKEEQEIRNYLTGKDLYAPETRAGLSQFGKTGLAYGKLISEQEKSGLETKKLRGDIAKQDIDVQREQFANLAFNPSNENVIAHIQDSVLQGKLPPAQAQSLLNQVLPMNPAQRKQFFTEMGVKVEERYKMTNLSEYQKQSLGIQREGQRMQYDPQLQARIAEAKEYGSALGKNRATAEAALPGAIETASEGIRLIDEMVGKAPVKDASGKIIQKGTAPHPGFSSYVGATLIPGMRFAEGSDTASFEIRQKQIEGKAFLEAFNALKGGGSITEKEGEKGTAAIMRMNKASSEKEYVAAARELQDIMRKGVERARAKAGGATAVPSATPAASAASGVIDFNSLK